MFGWLASASAHEQGHNATMEISAAVFPLYSEQKSPDAFEQFLGCPDQEFASFLQSCTAKAKSCILSDLRVYLSLNPSL